MASSILALGVIQENERISRGVRPLRQKAFELSDVEFVENFRLTKILAAQLIEELRIHLEPKTIRANAFSVETKVLTALRFFATGSYQKSVANDYLCSMSQSSVSNCITQVSDAMTNFLLKKYIVFPTERSEQEHIKQQFVEYCNLSGVIGAIDCTHVAIIAPHDDFNHRERNYVNRKNFHSINVQIVCDMQLRILNMVARFPGCTHDSYIWRSSNLRACFQHYGYIHGNGWLLGDSGYPGEQWLHVPFANPENAEEEEYNVAHAKGRSCIERCNGTLKSRFRCLLKHRTLNYSPETAAKITYACAILHNMCIFHNLEWENFIVTDDDEPFNTVENVDE